MVRWITGARPRRDRSASWRSRNSAGGPKPSLAAYDAQNDRLALVKPVVDLPVHHDPENLFAVLDCIVHDGRIFVSGVRQSDIYGGINRLDHVFEIVIEGTANRCCLYQCPAPRSTCDL